MHDGEFDQTPQFSPDGEHWWDGQRWIPAEQARAQAAAVAAVSPDAQPAYLPRVERIRGLTPFVWRQLAIFAVLLSTALVAWAVIVLIRPTPDEKGPVGKALKSAAAAEQAYLVKHKAYTGSPMELGTVGYLPRVGVTLTVIRADRRSYCLMGSRGDVRLYVTRDVSTTTPTVITTTPCV